MAAFTYNGVTLIGDIEVDAVVRETDGITNLVTDHEVEIAPGQVLSSVVDHVKRKPRTITIEGMISGSPITLTEEERAALTSNSGDSLLNPYEVGARTPSTVQAQLEELAESARLVTVTTPRRVYKSMVIESLAMPRSRETGNSLVFMITMREIRLVTNKETFVKVTRVSKMKPKVTQGQKPAVTVDNPPSVPTSSESAQSPLDVGGVSGWLNRKRNQYASATARGQ
jgi:hypothetical protein